MPIIPEEEISNDIGSNVDNDSVDDTTDVDEPTIDERHHIFFQIGAPQRYIKRIGGLEDIVDGSFDIDSNLMQDISESEKDSDDATIDDVDTDVEDFTLSDTSIRDLYDYVPEIDKSVVGDDPPPTTSSSLSGISLNDYTN